MRTAAAKTAWRIAGDLSIRGLKELNPRPPVLAKEPPGSDAEAFWIIKHGIKMTAMPALAH